MIIQRLNTDNFGLKFGATFVNVSPDGHFKLGDHSIEGPGEYDIAGVGLHVFGEWAILFAEGLRTTIVWGAITKIDSEEESSSDILMVLSSDSQQINTLVKEEDPRVVIFGDLHAAATLAKQDGLELVRATSYKITAQALPTIERVFVALS